MAARLAASGMPLGRVNKMRHCMTNDMVGPFYVDLPRSPPALRVGLANLRPLAQISRICVGNVDNAELLQAVLDRGLDLALIAHVAHAVFALHVRIRPEHLPLSLFEPLRRARRGIDGRGSCTRKRNG